MRAHKMSKEQAKSFSSSLARLEANLSPDLVGYEPYKELASAIVSVAVDDYRKALRTDDEELIDELERFFYSGYFKLLTDIDPVWLLDKLIMEDRGYTLDGFNVGVTGQDGYRITGIPKHRNMGSYS